MRGGGVLSHSQLCEGGKYCWKYKLNTKNCFVIFRVWGREKLSFSLLLSTEGGGLSSLKALFAPGQNVPSKWEGRGGGEIPIFFRKSEMGASLGQDEVLV